MVCFASPFLFTELRVKDGDVVQGFHLVMLFVVGRKSVN